jgi:ketosteroid isomerase-like protein
MPEHIRAFLSAWATAERAGDTETLKVLLTDDFSGTGPFGFVLPRPAWLERHRQGLTYDEFRLDEIQTRLYGDVAVVTARNEARGSYQGQRVPEALRATLVIASNSEAVRLAAVHMSFIVGSHGSPPLPEPTDSAGTSVAANANGEGQ